MPGQQEGHDVLLKVVLLGSQGCGKTSLLRRYLAGDFNGNPAESRPTHGVKSASRILHIDGQRVKVQLWDTQGHFRVHSMAKPFVRAAAGIMVVYDVAGEASSEGTWGMGPWQIALQHLKDVMSLTGGSATTMLVGTKADLEEQRTVSADDAKAFAANEGLLQVETSAAGSTNVDLAFDAYFAVKEEQRQRQEELLGDDESDAEDEKEGWL
ncbi:hypothetical protein N2152v2_010193 [Parachlorella kessleri]